MIELAAVQGIEVHLAMLQVLLFKQALGLEARCDLRPDGVVGADGLVGRVPEAEGLFRDRDVEAAGEVADRVAGGVAQIVAPYRFHNDLDRIRGVLGHQIGERMPAAVTAPALARFVAGFAPALLDHVFGAAARAAGDRGVDGREDNHSDASGVDASVVGYRRRIVKRQPQVGRQENAVSW